MRGMTNTQRFLACFVVFIPIVLAVCLSAVAGSSRPDPNDPAAVREAMLQRMAQLEQQITAQATQGFTPSLEMKENVDFVLTPALLMQEAMSEEIVTTYPTE